MGRKLIERQMDRMHKLVPSSGFATLDDVGKAVAALGPHRAKVVELLLKDDAFEFVTAKPESTRNGILQRGFLNQFDTGSSNGSYNPGWRLNAESWFLGMSRAEYEKIPNSVRPKYGYLRPAASTGVKMNDSGASHYGSDVFVFKREAVRDHLTFYPADSLGMAPYTSGPAATQTPDQWDQALLPWSSRMFLAPHLQVTNDGELQFGQAPPPGFKGRPMNTRYLEIQIWRPLGLEDVERFEFQTTPPSGDFLKSLRQNGVKIFKRGDVNEWKDDQPAAPHARIFRLHPEPVAKAA
jgi:hypothetical protein